MTVVVSSHWQEELAKALVILARHGIQPDIQGLLINGNEKFKVKPRALLAVIQAVTPEIPAPSDGKDGNAMDTAPKGTSILAWCDHEADRRNQPGNDGADSLTLYAAHGERGSFAETGWQILEWGGGFADGADDGGAWLPDWWFVKGSEFEVVANPVRWWPLPTTRGIPNSD